MRVTKPILRITGILMIGMFGLRAGAQEAADTGADMDEPATVEAPQSTALKVLDRPNGGPVVSVAERTDSAPRLAPAKAAATEPTLAGKTDNVSQVSPAKTRPTTDAVINMGKVETVTDRYPNGKVKIEREVGLDSKGNYVNQGTYKSYDLEGQISKSGEFLNGRLNGKWTQRFSKNEGYLFSPGEGGDFQGPFTSEATFLDGQLHGIWTIKDGNGQNILEWSFERGVRNGVWTWWHSNGNKRLGATFTSGTLNGSVQEWDRDGKQISKDSYIDGKRLVKVVGWYTLGQKHYEGFYLRSENMPEPTYDWWNSKVNTVAATAGGPDKQQGVWTSWYRNGNKETEAQYDHGVRVGKFKWYYENGQNQAEGDYDAGKKFGVWITWHPNGLKESMAEYHNDQLVGKYIHWDADGRLIDVVGDNGQTPAQPQPKSASRSPSTSVE